MAIERDIYKLTAKIGDQFVLRMLEEVHQDPESVAKAVQRAQSERQVPIKNKGYRLVNVLLLGGSKVVLNTPYFLDNHGLKPGPGKNRRCKSGRGFYPVLEALGIQNGVSPASRSEIALYTIEFIFIADGADWIWNRVKRLQTDAGIPEEIMIEAVDFYHACEHLSEAVELCTSMSRKSETSFSVITGQKVGQNHR